MEIKINIDEKFILQLSDITSKKNIDKDRLCNLLFKKAVINWITDNDDEADAISKLDRFMESIFPDENFE